MNGPRGGPLAGPPGARASRPTRARAPLVGAKAPRRPHGERGHSLPPGGRLGAAMGAHGRGAWGCHAAPAAARATSRRRQSAPQAPWGPGAQLGPRGRRDPGATMAASWQEAPGRRRPARPQTARHGTHATPPSPASRQRGRRAAGLDTPTPRRARPPCCGWPIAGISKPEFRNVKYRPRQGTRTAGTEGPAMGASPGRPPRLGARARPLLRDGDLDGL